MSILLDPDKQFVQFQLMYIEEINKQGSTKFYFIKSREDLDDWKSQGYLTSDEFKLAQDSSSQELKPGMAATSPPDTNKIIHILRTWWSQMSWKEQNQLHSRCLKQSTDDKGQIKMELDAIIFRDQKLKTCLKKWDLKDNGREIPLSFAVIDNLVPEVAQELLSQFESITEASKEEIKN